jgi:prepilin-type N-terminal cleavage/methylation domain-containing protein/prepilin-type processing-associated H-X9-DG protein
MRGGSADARAMRQQGPRPSIGAVRVTRVPRAAFSLVELLVVIGIVAVLISILLPAVLAARKQADAIACRARMRDVGMHLLMYANANQGWLFPTGRGCNVPPEERWPTRVFKPPVYDPPVLRCPDDVDDPAGEHSYLLNGHLPAKGIKYGRTNLGGGFGVTRAVLMGEKLSDSPDYYLERAEDFEARVELFRHGLKLRSNYLFLDLHVSNEQPVQWPGLQDPWDVPAPPLPATTGPTTRP